MVKKAKTKTEKRRPSSTEWSPGNPLAFPKKKNPTDDNLLARSVVEASIRESITPKKRKSTKGASG
jgi:hypothetical protein